MEHQKAKILVYPCRCLSELQWESCLPSEPYSLPAQGMSTKPEVRTGAEVQASLRHCWGSLMVFPTAISHPGPLLKLSRAPPLPTSLLSEDSDSVGLGWPLGSWILITFWVMGMLLV